MAVERFAGWVDPFAQRLRESRAEAVRLARSLGQEDLAAETADAGWSVRDELAHIASSDDDFLGFVRAVQRGETPDTSVFADIDERNARNLQSREGQSIARIANDLEENGIALQTVLQKFGEGDEARQPEGMPFTLGQMVHGYVQHEPYHLGQIREAVEGRQA